MSRAVLLSHVVICHPKRRSVLFWLRCKLRMLSLALHLNIACRQCSCSSAQINSVNTTRLSLMLGRCSVMKICLLHSHSSADRDIPSSVVAPTWLSVWASVQKEGPARCVTMQYREMSILVGLMLTQTLKESCLHNHT